MIVLEKYLIPCCEKKRVTCVNHENSKSVLEGAKSRLFGEPKVSTLNTHYFNFKMVLVRLFCVAL